MHHGDLVTLDKTSFNLSKNLLEPISIYEGSEIYGLYYPSVKSPVEADPQIKHDFMLTPIPPRLWPYLGKLNIILKHDSTALFQIAELLAKRNINIITTECTRSGHRYMSWSLTVAFEEFIRDEFHISNRQFEGNRAELETQKEALANQINQEISRLIMQINGMFADSIVATSKECCFSEELVTGIWIKALSYFHTVVLADDRGPIGVPFTAICEGNKILLSEEGKEKLRMAQLENELPAYGFAEMNTQDTNLRIAVLPNDLLKDFYKIDIQYERNSQKKGTSKGVVSCVTEEISKFSNIWKISVATSKNKEQLEKGDLQLCIQVKGQSGEVNSKVISEKVSTLKPVGDTMLSYVDVNPIRRFPIFISIKHNHPMRSVIIKECFEQGLKLGIFKNDFVYLEGDSGKVTEGVADKISNCKGMLQFFLTADYDTSMDWLHMEAFAATIKKMPFVRIINKELEQRLIVWKDKHNHIWDAENYETVVRQAIEDLICQIQRV